MLSTPYTEYVYSMAQGQGFVDSKTINHELSWVFFTTQVFGGKVLNLGQNHVEFSSCLVECTETWCFQKVTWSWI